MNFPHLFTSGKRQNALLIQPKAPVYAIIFDKSTGQLTGELTQEVTTFFTVLPQHFKNYCHYNYYYHFHYYYEYYYYYV